jgi:PAS domain S-box-containing protein
MPTATPEAFSDPTQLLAAYFSASPVGLAVFDTKLRYQAINKALADINGVGPSAHIGKTIRQVFGDSVIAVEPIMREVIRSGEPILNLEMVFNLPTRTEPGYFSENFFPIKDATGKVRQVGALVVEITDRKKLEAANLKLTNQIVRSQSEERSRIARELHDTTGQNLTGLIMNLASLKNSVSKLDVSFRKRFSDSLDLAKQSFREVRTLSYLLHPPMLDEFGLADTLRWYVRGFTQRSGIAVQLSFPKRVPRLEPEVESALFYVLQESLSNIRHSRNKRVKIRMYSEQHHVALEVQDFGRQKNGTRTLPKEFLMSGVGIPSMLERLKQFGGDLQVVPTPDGMLVRAIVPFRSKH